MKTKSNLFLILAFLVGCLFVEAVDARESKYLRQAGGRYNGCTWLTFNGPPRGQDDAWFVLPKGKGPIKGKISIYRCKGNITNYRVFQGGKKIKYYGRCWFYYPGGKRLSGPIRWKVVKRSKGWVTVNAPIKFRRAGLFVAGRFLGRN